MPFAATRPQAIWSVNLRYIEQQQVPDYGGQPEGLMFLFYHGWLGAGFWLFLAALLCSGAGSMLMAAAPLRPAAAVHPQRVLVPTKLSPVEIRPHSSRGPGGVPD